ncbi:2'-5' RNA ligase family protein [Dactylosporangium sp. NBC_01737]|uniref:2'-5' RNA ligase family protein n=1 Tax=Dactylosporangium sp. NBC_01737 TaxID=2975959 RepID=UPI002E11F227|nr:2'-5' RNA ligase family protein [Dactylosporangium sp. NBC_01737]
MQRFITAERTWPERTRWHVYVLPDLDADPDLRRLVGQSRAVMSRYPALSVVPDQWLHATMQMVTGRAGDDVTDAQRAALVDALRERVGGLAPFTATAGSVLATRSGVVLDLDQDLPGEPFAVLGSGVRAAIGAVFGDDGLRYDPDVPHISLAYAAGDDDSGEVQGHLRRTVRPSRTRLSVAAVWLLDVIQDPARSQYRWHEPLARIPLTGRVDQPGT